MFLILFFIEFALIFFLSREVSKTVSQLLLTITRSHKVTIHILSFIFLPGVILHELSHWIMANLLFVQTGTIEFMPKIRDNKVKLGSVSVAKTDPFRRFFIGVAPIIIGLITIFGIYIALFPDLSLVFSWKIILFLYLLFEIGNTMYSSSKDMEGAVVFFIIIAIFVLLYFLFGLHLPSAVIQAITSDGVQNVFQKMDIFLGILGGIDLVISKGLTFLIK
ncbi:MAG TPA: hypothetical protein VLF89_04750 [Candidatus Saccharimonadales bacterium]|nr:hypothetical protein [Candidatus Saccharimonadales bacterium]